jgi:glycosyltransferase involved in cell wall biosynthesis
MRVCIASDNRFDRTPDGSIWAQMCFPFDFWTRYLDVFDEVHVVGRVRDVAEPTAGWVRSNGPSVDFTPLPYYVGPRQYLAQRGNLRRSMGGSFQSDDAVILRVPGQIGTVMHSFLKARRHPYAVEVIGNPYDAFARGASNHPLRPVFQWLMPRKLEMLTRGACAGSYVTEAALQRRYPLSPSAFATHYSSIALTEAHYADEPRTPSLNGKPIKLIQVASFDVPYKATDVLLDSVALCVEQGLELELEICGEGTLRPQLEEYARQKGLGQRANFVGLVSGMDNMNRRLDASDIFVLPSLTEGLPRAMIEAMARGLPCIGTTVGGIPELISDDCLVPPSDAASLASCIRALASSPKRQAETSQINLKKAAEFKGTELQQRRNQLFEHLKEKTLEASRR